jgi:hypothetical protein
MSVSWESSGDEARSGGRLRDVGSGGIFPHKLNCLELKGSVRLWFRYTQADFA